MRGVGGPLLCIGDLLSDVADDGDAVSEELPSSMPPPASSGPILSPMQRSTEALVPSDLQQLFEENYNLLDKALEGTDHSWTEFTLKLCSALEMADKMMRFASTNVQSLLGKLNSLERILARGDSAVQDAKPIVKENTNESS